MKLILLLSLVLITCVSSTGSWADDSFRHQQEVLGEARQGFEQILDLWRQEQYNALYDRLVPAPGSSRWNFIDQLNHSGRRPACCWEKLQEVTSDYLDDTSVLITARLGIEVEGFGTRFVTRTFRLVKKRGIWKLPETDIISLAEPNMQRIPREILIRPY